MAEREGTQDITNNSRIRHNTYGADPSYAKVIYRAADPETINAFYDYIESHYFRSTPGQALELQTRDNVGAYQNRITLTGEVANSVFEFKPDGTNVRFQIEDNLVTSNVDFASDVIQSTPGAALSFQTRDNLGAYQTRQLISGEVANAVIDFTPDGTNMVLSVDAGNVIIDQPLIPNAADSEAIGATDAEIANMYLGTGRFYMYTDQGESMRSDGTQIIWAVATVDELKLSSTALFPNAASGLDLGTPDQEYQHAYIASHIYFWTDQGEHIYSDGSDLIFGVATADELKLNGTALYPSAGSGLDLGLVGTQWGDAYIDGVAYIDGLTIEVSLDVDAIDIAATGLGGLQAVIPCASLGGTGYIAIYDGYT